VRAGACRLTWTRCAQVFYTLNGSYIGVAFQIELSDVQLYAGARARRRAVCSARRPSLERARGAWRMRLRGAWCRGIT
jgi:hypothetical protein